MVAYDARQPPDPARPLTPELRARLRDAVLAQWRVPDRELVELGDTLRAVADDARARGLRAEDLIIALHEIQLDVSIVEGRLMPEKRDRVHTWLVRACLRAYFRERA
ncbi:MAG TPA: hypothetical protein VHM67_09320 [Gemmatimonadaceae bacterium]|nr:hypothetical protein [Gemmatimonadaceae bacterium]